MKKSHSLFSRIIGTFLFIVPFCSNAQIVISQYYEGGGTNKWIELANIGTTAVNLASPQLKLGLWSVSGSTGNIVFSGAPSNTYNLTVTIPAKGTVLIGNTGNGTEVPYLTAASANETSNSVINFNGNDGIALLDASNNIIDKFGEGINAADISYVRSTGITGANATYTASEWANTSLATVQSAAASTPQRLGYQLAPLCVAPLAQATSLSFSSITSNSMSGSFTASGADGYVVVQSTSSSLSANPVDATTYSVGNSLGGGIVVSAGSPASFSTTGLSPNTTYYFFVFAYNNSNCSGGPKYLTSSPLTGSQATPYPPCVAPTNSATAMFFSSVTSTSMTVSFTAASSVDGYLVVRSTNSSLGANPANGTPYVAGSTIGSGTVVSVGTPTSVNQTGLTASTTYYFFVFTYNQTNCTSAPAYNISALTGSRATDPAALSWYFGNLHSHSSYSDGNSDNTNKTPADDYAFAKTAMCMDFLGISEHNHAGAGMSLSDWAPGKAQAAAATVSNFVAMHGQEWGVIGTQGSAGDHAGHVIVYGLDSLAGWEAGNYQIYVPKSVYTGTGGLFDIINRHGNNAFASLAHPDNYDYNDILHTGYDVKADDAIAGSNVETGPAFSTDTTYTNPGTLATFAFYKNMLAKGYHLGPTIDHDNHNMTFGKTTKSRLVIMATSLSEANILDAMRKMRFYASEDCNAKITFTVNGTYPMGSIVTKPGAPTLTVTSVTTNTVTSIKLMYGVPGSGTAATQLTSSTNGSLTYTHTALANLATCYYFLDITESNGTRVITSPIWYTRDNSASRPAFVTSLFTISEPGKVVLKWTASNEPAGESYEVQRSVDGRVFATIGAKAGMGHGMPLVTYAIEDLNPLYGLSYYRLVNKYADGRLAYSDAKAVNRSTGQPVYLMAYPNPVGSMLTIKIASIANENTQIDILDMAGRVVKRMPVLLSYGEQTLQLNVSSLAKGTYIIKVPLDGKMQTQMLSKL